MKKKSAIQEWLVPRGGIEPPTRGFSVEEQENPQSPENPLIPSKKPEHQADTTETDIGPSELE